jgi:ADP-heptose:LPS heptosyltransferase
MPPLQIYDRRERTLVAAADAAFAAAAGLTGPLRRRSRPLRPERILLLRLERIGDLLMVLGAIADLRAAAPAAEITLVVGGWNEGIARSIPGVTRVEALSANWLARGSAASNLPGLLRHARGWRRQRFDLGINFEPDIRSNLLLAASGAAWTAGYRSGGGGPLLDQALDFRPAEHTSDNARRLVAEVLPGGPGAGAPVRLALGDEPRRRASELLARARGPLVGMHVPGGRQVKQWDPDRFTAVAQALIRERGATIVLTGSPDDRALVSRVRNGLDPARVVDASTGLDLLTVAAVLERCDLVVTGDTGPMHLAGAVGAPIVAVFGPSNPARYAPRGALDRVVRVDLPCAPCNRIRLPPARCTGRIPDCLALITPDHVLQAARDVLDACDKRVPAERRV